MENCGPAVSGGWSGDQESSGLFSCAASCATRCWAAGHRIVLQMCIGRELNAQTCLPARLACSSPKAVLLIPHFLEPQVYSLL